MYIEQQLMLFQSVIFVLRFTFLYGAHLLVKWTEIMLTNIVKSTLSNLLVKIFKLRNFEFKTANKRNFSRWYCLHDNSIFA